MNMTNTDKEAIVHALKIASEHYSKLGRKAKSYEDVYVCEGKVEYFEALRYKLETELEAELVCVKRK